MNDFKPIYSILWDAVQILATHPNRIQYRVAHAMALLATIESLPTQQMGDCYKEILKSATKYKADSQSFLHKHHSPLMADVWCTAERVQYTTAQAAAIDICRLERLGMAHLIKEHANG